MRRVATQTNYVVPFCLALFGHRRQTLSPDELVSTVTTPATFGDAIRLTGTDVEMARPAARPGDICLNLGRRQLHGHTQPLNHRGGNGPPLVVLPHFRLRRAILTPLQAADLGKRAVGQHCVATNCGSPAQRVSFQPSSTTSCDRGRGHEREGETLRRLPKRAPASPTGHVARWQATGKPTRTTGAFNAPRSGSGAAARCLEATRRITRHTSRIGRSALG